MNVHETVISIENDEELLENLYNLLNGLVNKYER